MTMMTNCGDRLPLPPEQVSQLTKNTDQPYESYYSDPQWYSAYTQGRKAFYGIPEQFNDDQFYLDWANKNRCTSILDVGCGDGAKSNLLAQSGFRVVGIDNSREMIEFAQQQYSQAQFIPADIQTLNLDQKFDLILLRFELINHLLQESDLEAAFLSLSKLLNDNGSLIIDTVNLSLESIINIHFNKRQNLDSVFEDPRGRGTVYVTQTKSYDEATQLLTLVKQFCFVKTQESWPIKIDFRIYYPRELELILKYNGFTVQDKFGNFDGSNFCSQSKKMIFVCRKITET